MRAIRRVREGIRSRRRRRSERGGALVETALVALPLIVLTLGLVEFGLMWGDQMTLDRASRSSARVAAQVANDGQADREALRAMIANIAGADRLEVEYVVIYHETGGGMPPACATGSTASCNHYTPVMLGGLDTDSLWACGGSAFDSGWCPTTREAELHAPIDLGAVIKVKRSGVTGMFGDEFDLSSTTVMRLNPIHR